ncbi:MAG: hypothetical protein Q8L37_02365 [Candidatus Gottesmanbacteria bacterium]|nr:hypothetical protein [Candidatus Gottesmanbacteria bacterium]
MSNLGDLERVEDAFEKIVLEARVEKAKHDGMNTLFDTGSLGAALTNFAENLSDGSPVISGSVIDLTTGRPVSYVVFNPSVEQIADHKKGILPRVSVASVPKE